MLHIIRRETGSLLCNPGIFYAFNIIVFGYRFLTPSFTGFLLAPLQVPRGLV